MKTAELIIKMLEEEGVEYIFGFPGGAVEELNTALYKSDRIKAIVPKHEEGAAFMADSYARVSGKLGVCCASTGPGSTNLITGLATSYVDCIPVCALTGQVATRDFGKGAFHESSSEGVNVVGIFTNFTKYSRMLLNKERSQYMIQKAIRLAKTYPSGPVHIGLPMDVLKQTVPSIMPGQPRVMGGLFDRQGVKSAAKLLVSAKRPVIFVGWGTVLSRGARQLLELAELLQIPVATSPKSKGVFPESNPLCLGSFGFAGSPVAVDYLVDRDVDVLLAVGTGFKEFTTGGWDERLKPTGHLIHIDVDAEKIGKNYTPSVGVVGDAKTVLNEIAYAVKREFADDEKKMAAIRERGNLFKAEIRELKEKHASLDEQPEHRNGLYHPRLLVEDLQNSFPEDTIFFSDIGSVMAWSIRYLVMDKPYSFYVSLGLGGMGYATAAPIGAWLAGDGRPVVSMVGDGGFLMNGQEIATAVNHDIPAVWVVFNNAMYGMIYHGRKMYGGVPEGLPSRFTRVNLAKVAEGLGARGIRIDKPGSITPNLVADILAEGRPTLLDVRIDEEAVPPIGSRIKTMERHFD